MGPLRQEDRDLQERLFGFAVRIVRLCQKLDEQRGAAGLLSRQLLKAGTSIGANYEEAQAGQSRADFIAKVTISLKEARETRYWLRLLVVTETVSAELLSDLIDEAEQITKILGSIVSRAEKNEVTRTREV